MCGLASSLRKPCEFVGAGLVPFQLRRLRSSIVMCVACHAVSSNRKMPALCHMCSFWSANGVIPRYRVLLLSGYQNFGFVISVIQLGLRL